MKLLTRATIIGAAALAGLTLGVGAAIATGGPGLVAPLGLSPANDQAFSPMPEPTYKTNAVGQTYGSASNATSPDKEPDLILVVASNGVEGFVLKSELDAANGSDVQSPDEAIRWTVTEGRVDRVIPVYLSDGRTQVGEFVITGLDSQEMATR